MQSYDFNNVIISFERPKNSKLTKYEFLQNPPQSDGGGLRDQVVMIREELSWAEFIHDFTQASTMLTEIIGEKASFVVSAVVSWAWNIASVDIFPDKYKEILDLIEKRAKEEILNQAKLNVLLEENSEMKNILDALIEQKYLRKKSNGDYVVRKKILTNVHISFLKTTQSKE